MNYYAKNGSFFLGVAGDHRGCAVCLSERLGQNDSVEYAVRFLRVQRQPNPAWLLAQTLEAAEFLESEFERTKRHKKGLIVSKAEDLREWLAKPHAQFDHSAPELESSTALLTMMGAINSRQLIEVDDNSQETLENELKLLSENTESVPDLGIVSEALIFSLGEICGRDSILKRPNPVAVPAARPSELTQRITAIDFGGNWRSDRSRF